MTDQPTHSQQRGCCALFGKQGVGKSSLEHEIINSYKKRGGDVMVLTPHPAQFGKDGVLCHLGNVEQIVAGIMESGYTGLVVFDDADAYMNPRSSAVITQLCTTFRHYGIDLLMSSRSPQQININLRRCFTRVVVFRMGPEPRARRAVRDLLAEQDFPKAIFRKLPPKESFCYLNFDLDTGTVVEGKTKKLAE